MSDLEFGLDTFGDVPEDDLGQPDCRTPRRSARSWTRRCSPTSSASTSIALGEHHRPEYAISTPETVLAGIADPHRRGSSSASGVTVLLRRPGPRLPALRHRRRAVATAAPRSSSGRGSFTESFPLFGYDLRDYDLLFEEKIDLFARLLDEKPVTWSGTTRAPLVDADVFPKTESGRLTTWVGVGGSPQSVVRTARYGLPLMLAIIGGAAGPLRARTSTSTGAPPSSSAPPPTRSACTRPASSPTPTRRPASCSGRATA